METGSSRLAGASPSTFILGTGPSGIAQLFAPPGNNLVPYSLSSSVPSLMPCMWRLTFPLGHCHLRLTEMTTEVAQCSISLCLCFPSNKKAMIRFSRKACDQRAAGL